MFLVDKENGKVLSPEELREKTEYLLTMKLKEANRNNLLEDCLAEVITNCLSETGLTIIHNFCSGKEVIENKNTLNTGGGYF